MPYGIPWTSSVEYHCVNCGVLHTSGGYMPYCGFCGVKQPSEKKAQAIGLAEFGPTVGKRRTHDIDEINAFLAIHHGKPMRFWHYGVSHSELELRLRHSGAPCDSREPWLNTVIYCSATKQIHLPVLWWDCSMRIESVELEDGPLYTLLDRPHGVRIECRMVSAYFDVEPGL